MVLKEFSQSISKSLGILHELDKKKREAHQKNWIQQSLYLARIVILLAIPSLPLDEEAEPSRTLGPRAAASFSAGPPLPVPPPPAWALSPQGRGRRQSRVVG